MRGGKRHNAGRKKQGDAIFYERCTPEKKEYLKIKSLDYDFKKEKNMKKYTYSISSTILPNEIVEKLDNSQYCVCDIKEQEGYLIVDRFGFESVHNIVFSNVEEAQEYYQKWLKTKRYGVDIKFYGSDPLESYPYDFQRQDISEGAGGYLSVESRAEAEQALLDITSFEWAKNIKESKIIEFDDED